MPSSRLAGLVILLGFWSTPAYAQCPEDVAPVYVTFLNGVWIPNEAAASAAAERLESLVTADPRWLEVASDCVTFDYSYNRLDLDGIGGIDDLIVQFFGSIVADGLRVLGGVLAPSQFFSDSMTGLASAVDLVACFSTGSDCAKLDSLIQARTRDGIRTIAVAHSQGNFYANEILSRLASDKRPLFDIIAVATPTGASEEIAPYINLRNDPIAYLSGLPSSVDNDEPCMLFGCHLFKTSYLHGRKSRAALLDLVFARLPSRRPPPPPPPATRLDWTVQPDGRITSMQPPPWAEGDTSFLWQYMMKRRNETVDTWGAETCHGGSGGSQGTSTFRFPTDSFVSTGNMNVFGMSFPESRGGIGILDCTAAGTYYFEISPQTANRRVTYYYEFYYDSSVPPAPAPSWTLAPPPTLPAGSYPALAYDSVRQETILFGGALFLDATWAWNGTTWVERLPAARPPGRVLHTLAFDQARSEIVLFGGSAGAVELGDTWTWDGLTWHQRFPSVSPRSRTYHVMVYDAGRHETVMFGGHSPTWNNETWIWDGSNWTQRQPAMSPPAGIVGSMAYDPVRGEVLWYGSGQTWTWDGSNWTRHFPGATPTNGQFSTMAFDFARNQMVLFGGDDGNAPQADTWTWNGSDWTEVVLQFAPPAQTLHSMTSDSIRKEIVLFGIRARTPFPSPLGTWIWK